MKDMPRSLSCLSHLGLCKSSPSSTAVFRIIHFQIPSSSMIFQQNRVMTILRADCLFQYLMCTRFQFFMVFSLLLQGLLHSGPIKTGEQFPKLASFELLGELPKTKGKVLLIDIWASWCLPCKKSFPVLNELYLSYQSKGLVILAVSVDEKKSEMEAFLKKQSPQFSVLHDSKGKLAEDLAIETMPTSILVDREGTVICVHSGFEGDRTRKKWVADIEKALKSTKP